MNEPTKAAIAAARAFFPYLPQDEVITSLALALDAYHRAGVAEAVDAEPEFPGAMPDEMWEEVKGDRDAWEESMRIAVRLTKKNIRERALGHKENER
jgi:hypothetical protein